MQRLRVLRALLATTVDYRSHGQRDCDISTKHVPPLGGLSYKLIHRQEHEVDSRMNHDRAVAAERRAKRGAGSRQFGHGSIDDTSRSELLLEIGHRVADIPGTPQSLTDREHFRVIREEMLEPFPNRDTVRR